MSLTPKSLIVHFFKVELDEAVLKKFVGTFNSLRKLGTKTEIVNLSQSRFLLHCLANKSGPSQQVLFWSVVKERNTWQVRTRQDGSLEGLQQPNSLVGDLSFFKFDAKRKVLAAFTTYSGTGYLRSISKSVFKHLLPRSAAFGIEYLSDDQKISQIKRWDYFSRISIKLNTTSISDEDEKPDLIRALLNIRETFGGNTISVTLGGGDERLPKQDVAETVNYLSSSGSCESLNLAGGMFDEEEKTLPLNLKKAFVRYTAIVELRGDQKYINVSNADSVLTEAFSNTQLSHLVD